MGWRITRPAAILLTLALVVSGCTATAEQEAPSSPTLAAVRDKVSVIDGSAAEMSIAASGRFFKTSPTVVVAVDGDYAAIGHASTAAVGLGVPLIVAERGSGDTGPIAAELDRLGSGTVVAFGSPTGGWQPYTGDRTVVAGPDSAEGFDKNLGLKATPADSKVNELQQSVAALQRDKLGLISVQDADTAGRTTTEPSDEKLPDTAASAKSVDATVVAGRQGTAAAPALATARAANSPVLNADSENVFGSQEVIDAVHKRQDKPVIGIGIGPESVVQYRLESAQTGYQLPGGGQTVFPGRRMIALYGHPGTKSMGVLGEQGIDESIARAKKVAKSYQKHSEEPVVPTFELIATVASAAKGKDGDYSYETPAKDIEPWIDAAEKAGVYVVLDIQPGRTDFLTQAKLYEDLLKRPNVGLALDPEWRLKSNQKHLAQVGSVKVEEVNEVLNWLADLTRENKLPQKVFTLHQFKLKMIQDRERLDTSREELAIVLHADGHGSPGEKMSTWQALQKGLPKSVWMGWKNFYDEDKPTFSPEQTYAIDPKPWFVSYQ
ncbi:hypothetical protein LWF01_04470 [Saxibacter everestensis]|uniref:Lipoprotein n=1 Tax=Saxibacter everestensis TaxID=2909229 RepID=A0ABY8QVI5_9MICO|nr:hypothetical protein LWF01_04470 [Brevibacteriaceae bacterium ZFBP1038]